MRSARKMPTMRMRIGKPDRAAFGKRLNTLLDGADWCAKGRGRNLDVATRYRVAPSSAFGWLNGKSIPDQQRGKAVARDLGVSFDYLIFGDASLNGSAASAASNEPVTTGSQPLGMESLTVALNMTFTVLALVKPTPRPSMYAAVVKSLYEALESGQNEAQVLQFARRMADVLSTGGQHGSKENGGS